MSWRGSRGDANITETQVVSDDDWDDDDDDSIGFMNFNEDPRAIQDEEERDGNNNPDEEDNPKKRAIAFCEETIEEKHTDDEASNDQYEGGLEVEDDPVEQEIEGLCDYPQEKAVAFSEETLEEKEMGADDSE